MRTTTRVAAVAAAQLAIVAVAVAPRLSAHLVGEEYLLEVAGADPHDPFRGAYAALDYPGLRLHGEQVPDGPAYLPLRPSDGVWVSGAPVRERPTEGPYLACEGDGWDLDCGIGSWFAGDDEADRVGRALTTASGVATVRIDGRGNAVLVDVRTSAVGGPGPLSSPRPPRG